MRRGFTVVEIIITLVVMGILLGLGTVGLQSTLKNGRDSERKSDIDAIATALETRYVRGNLDFTLDTSGYFYNGAKKVVEKGTYPGAMEFKYAVGYPKGEFVPAQLSNDRESLYKSWQMQKSAALSPKDYKLELVCYTPSCAAAEDQAQLIAAFGGSAASPVDRYIYEPIDASGAICNAADFNYATCPRFNLYWISETDTTPYKTIPGLKMLRSKHR